MKKFGLKSYVTKPETNPYAGKIICGHCNKPYIRKTWKSGHSLRKVWQCQERYRIKGIEGCSNQNIDESSISRAYDYVYEEIINRKDDYIKNCVTLRSELLNWLDIMERTLYNNF